MALNPQYDAIGKAFVQQYYTLFDDANQRHQLVNLYNVSVIVLKFPINEKQEINISWVTNYVCMINGAEEM